MLRKAKFLVVVSFVLLIPFNLLYAHETTSLKNSQQSYQIEEVIFRRIADTPVGTIDPASARRPLSIEIVENLFLGLTDIDPITQRVVPEMAEDWSVSSDGLIWTFHLRDDVYWVHYDSTTESVEKVRLVVAADFAYSIKRACDPRSHNYLEQFLGKFIQGCDTVAQIPFQSATNEMVFGDTIQVNAIDDTTLTIALHSPVAYFPAISSLSFLHAQPQDIIEQYGTDWTQSSTILTNGPYFLKEANNFYRNTYLPTDLLRGTGNIEIVRFAGFQNPAPDSTLIFNNQLDMISLTKGFIQNIPLTSGSEEILQQIVSLRDPVIHYLAFNYNQPPFDNVHVRRAFSSVIDRDLLVEQALGGLGIPIAGFDPTVTLETTGNGAHFDPDYARAELAEAGYPNCSNFPPIIITTIEEDMALVDFWMASAVDHLGCNADLFKTQVYERGYVPSRPYQQPHVWVSWWQALYPDPNAFLNERFSCTTSGFGATERFDLSLTGLCRVDDETCIQTRAIKRPCTEADSLLQTASVENDPSIRRLLYDQAETLFWGNEGEYPAVPLFLHSRDAIIRPWVSGPFATDSIFGAMHWDSYSIDTTLKAASQP